MGDLDIRDLVVEYSGAGDAVRPIDHLDLQVSAGSLAILLGPSGCGKTTLLSCIGGILKPTSGQILFDNIDVTALDGHSLTVYRRNTVGITVVRFRFRSPSFSFVSDRYEWTALLAHRLHACCGVRRCHCCSTGCSCIAC